MRAWTVMGVVNVTPDSFSDGGLWLDADAAIEHGRERSPRGRRRSSTSAASRRGRAPSRSPRARSCAASCPSIEGLRGGPGAQSQRRHLEARRSARAALAAGATLRQRRHRVPRRAGDGRARRRGGLRLLPDAHAGRAAHDAGATRGTTTSSTTSRRSSRSGWRSPSRRASPRSASQLDPGIGFGKTRRAQPRAAAAPRRDRRARPPGRRRRLAQGFLGALTGRRSRRSASPATIADERARARARRAASSASTTSPPTARCAWRSLLLRCRPMTPTTTTSRDEDSTTRRTRRRRRVRRGARAHRGHRRDHRALALHPPRRERGRARDRPAADPRPALRRRRLRRHRHRPHRGHGGLRARSARSSRSSRSSAPTRRSSASARRSPTACSTTSRPSEVWVKATKPEPPIALPVE